jgi:hypothetical protein
MSEYNPQKYEILKAERNKLKFALDKYSNMMHHPLYQATRAKYVMKVRQIKQMFKTHA